LNCRREDVSSRRDGRETISRRRVTFFRCFIIGEKGPYNWRKSFQTNETADVSRFIGLERLSPIIRLFSPIIRRRFLRNFIVTLPWKMLQKKISL
jgi:hypothetical protein